MAHKAARALEIMREFAKNRISGGRFDSAVLSKATITEGSEGHVKCKIPVTPELLNGIGTLHGGAVATMVDSVSTWALVSVGNNVPGVSVDLSISFMKAANPGDIVEVEARVSHLGRRLAFLNVDVTSSTTGSLLAQGRHVKFVGGQGEKKNSTESSPTR